MASAAVTAATNRIYCLESDSTAREYTSAVGRASDYYISVSNVGSNPAVLTLSDSSPDMDPDAPDQQAGEILLPVGYTAPLPLGVQTFYHKSTTGSTLNVVMDKRHP